MIRLARFGKIKHPSYRIIVSDKRKDTQGKYLESLGQYYPHKQPTDITVNKDRLLFWMSKGAQLSDTLHNIFVEKKIIEGTKRSLMHKKEVKEEAKTEPAAKAAEPTKEAPAKEAAPVPDAPKA